MEQNFKNKIMEAFRIGVKLLALPSTYNIIKMRKQNLRKILTICKVENDC